MAKKTKDQPSPLIPSDPLEPPRKQSLFAWLRARFFAGMIIAAPIAITFWVLQFLITFIDDRVKPLLPPILKPETYTNYAIPGVGVLVTVVALTVLGAVATNLIGRSLINSSDRLLSGIPIVRNVYSAFKQLFEVLGNNQTASFDSVVLVEYPRRGSWCIGFVASGAKGEVKARLSEGHIGVFVPTTPNPTSGFLVYVQRAEVKELDMTVEEGAKLILSAGLVVPEAKTNESGELPFDAKSLPASETEAQEGS